LELNFKDNFSAQAADYAKFRPRYPDSLFEYLASLTSQRQLAWDCGTGNGQCAISLAKRFDKVIASDASQKQLNNAEPHPRVEYQCAAAEQAGLDADSVDLLTVAQALHWFRIEDFWKEAQRIVRPDGVIAVWCYAFLHIAPKIDAVVNRFYSETVGPYWDFERKLVEDGYETISFPFAELSAPSFAIETSWSLPHLLGYLQSWSATQKFMKANGINPVERISAELAELWGDPMFSRLVRWPLRLRVGRNA
jgi:SAM-dependent methyltransferase